MLGSQNSPTIVENSALAVQGYPFNREKQQKNRLVCEHCRKVGHTKDTCWKIHGKPENWKPSREKEGCGNVAATEPQTSSETHPFCKEQLEVLQKMFQQTLQSIFATIGNSSLAQKGIRLEEEDWQC